jgi:hypothetical protein
MCVVARDYMLSAVFVVLNCSCFRPHLTSFYPEELSKFSPVETGKHRVISAFDKSVN